MKASIEIVIEQQQTKDFLTISRDFCAFIESIDKSGDDYLRQLQTILLTLYQRAIYLPWTTLELNQEFQVDLTKAEIESILRKLADKIGDDRYYWLVFDPTDDNDTESVCGDLVDDIGDTYKEVKRGLLVFDLGTMASKEHGIWELKFLFEKHWGQHTIDALRTIHFLLEE
jgi:hypothetical protein